MNFSEGTRFTAAKHASQNSPYKHLLKPKTGALGMAIEVLGDKFRSFLDLTIVYPDGAPTFWAFLSGRVPRVIVRATVRTVPPEVAGTPGESDEQQRRAPERRQHDPAHDVQPLSRKSKIGCCIIDVAGEERSSQPLKPPCPARLSVTVT